MANLVPGKDILGNTAPERAKLFRVLYAMIAEAGNAFDILSATPPRNLQVFGNQYYSQISGLAAHPVLVPIVLAISFVLPLPFVAKVFMKQQENNLQKLWDKLVQDNEELPTLNKAEKISFLKNKFNTYLHQRRVYHLEAQVEYKPKRRLKNRFAKKDELSLKLVYQTQLKTSVEAILNKNWEKNKDKTVLQLTHGLLNDDLIKKVLQAVCPADEVEKLNTYSHEALQKLLLNKILTSKQAVLDAVYQNENSFAKEERDRILLLTQLYGFFVKKSAKGKDEFDYETSFEESKARFIENLNNIDFKTKAKNFYDFLNNLNFKFWLAFYVQDCIASSPDTMAVWPANPLINVLGAMFLMGGIDGVLDLIHYSSNKTKKNETRLPDHISNKDLKHKIEEDLFIEVETEKRHEALALNPDNQYRVNNDLVSPDPNKKPLFRGVIKPTKIHQQFELLRDAALKDEHGTDRKKSSKKKQIINTANHLGTQVIIWAFMGWVAGVVVGAADAANKVFGKWLPKINLGLGLSIAGATVAAIAILGNPASLIIAGVGLVVGIFFAIYGYRQEKENKARLQAQLKINAPKIEELEKLEEENKRSRKLLKANNITPLTVIKASDDHGFRRLTTEKAGAWTLAKKIFNRGFVGLARAESGVLLVRLVIIPAILVVIGATVLTPVGWIIAGASAIGLGITWAAMNVYLYHQESKLKVAQRTLNDIDNRIKVARENNAIYQEQLKQAPPPSLPNNDRLSSSNLAMLDRLTDSTNSDSDAYASKSSHSGSETSKEEDDQKHLLLDSSDSENENGQKQDENNPLIKKQKPNSPLLSLAFIGSQRKKEGNKENEATIQQKKGNACCIL